VIAGAYMHRVDIVDARSELTVPGVCARILWRRKERPMKKLRRAAEIALTLLAQLFC
jgi:hypothetical protein